MFVAKHKPLIAFQKKLHEDALDRVHGLIGQKSKILSDYSLSFQKDLPTDFSFCDENSIMKSVHGASIVFFGDFHTSGSGPSSLVCVAEDYLAKYKEPIVFALEAFKESDQNLILDYMEAKISEEQFLTKIQYKKNWGFSWLSYKKILDFAKKNHIPIYGINHQKESLAQRDESISGNLSYIFWNEKEAKIFCLIGEHHLASNHLPRLLENKLSQFHPKEKKICRILTDNDHYFFRAKYLFLEQDRNYLQLEKDFFCILRLPPWIKWRSYYQWQEAFLNDQDHLFYYQAPHFMGSLEEGEDFFHYLLLELVNFLKIPKKELDLYRFHLKEIRHPLSKNGTSFAISFGSNSSISSSSSSDVSFLELDTMEDYFYAAGLYLFHCLCKPVDEKSSKEQFLRQVLSAFMGSLCVKIFNPCANRGAFGLDSSMLQDDFFIEVIEAIKNSNTAFLKKHVNLSPSIGSELGRSFFSKLSGFQNISLQKISNFILKEPVLGDVLYERFLLVLNLSL